MAASDAEAPAVDFYTSLVPVLRFRHLAEIERYDPVPDDTTLFLADVVGSTAAIETGRYKEVNVAAAAVIAAIRNALADRDLAFSFGGDGASFVLGAEHAALGRRTLAATVRWAADELGLDLRAAAVPVADIRQSGHDLLVARFAVSADLSYAMFAGGGLAWAETRMKDGAYAIAADEGAGGLDLSGLSCRFARLPSRNGVILSVIVVPNSRRQTAAFSQIVVELLDLAAHRHIDVRPVPDGAPKVEWSLERFVLETKTAAAKAGGRRLASILGSGIRNAVAHYTMRTGRRIGGFDPKRYLTEVVQNTDFRKFDDGLRMTVDCSVDTADEIEALLSAGRSKGQVDYGTHRQDAAMLTCFVPSPKSSDHVHFVDGAAGGYALAAQALKAQQKNIAADVPVREGKADAPAAAP